MDQPNAKRATTHADPAFVGWFETSMRAWDMAAAFWKLAKATGARTGTWEALAATLTSLGDNITLIGNQLNGLHCPTIHSNRANGAATSSVVPEDLLSQAVNDEIASCVKIVKGLRDSLATIQESLLGPVDHDVLYDWLGESVGEPLSICKQITLHNQALRLILLAAHISSSSTMYAPSYPLQSKIAALERMMQQLHEQDPEDRHSLVLQHAATVVTQDQVESSVNVAPQPVAVELDASAASSLATESRLRRNRSQAQDGVEIGPQSPLPASPVQASDEDLRPKPLRTSVVSSAEDFVPSEDRTNGNVSPNNRVRMDMPDAAIYSAGIAMRKQKWSEAEPLLREAWSVMNTAQYASSLSPALCSMMELEYFLALCAFHTQTPEAAQAVLIKYLKHKPETDEQRRQVCDAQHLLSMLYIRTGQLGPAQIQAENVVNGRLALDGKEHEAYHEALLLLARICELRGDQAQANLCLSSVPESKRESIYAKLALPPAPPTPRTPKSPTSPGITREMSKRSLQPQNPFTAAIIDTPVPSRRSSKFSAQTSFSLFSESRDSVGSARSGSTVSHVDFSQIPFEVADGQTRAALCDAIGFSPSGPDRELEQAICAGLTEMALAKIKAHRPEYRGPESCLLHLAALFGDVELAKVLLATDDAPPVDALTTRCIRKIKYQLTPLHLAMGARYPHMVHFLLQQGAALRTPSHGPGWVMAPSLQFFRDIWLPFMNLQRTIDVLNITFSAGWNVNESVTYASNRRTLLGEVVKLEKGAADPQLAEKLVQFLISKGAEPMAVSTDRLLHHAAQNEDVGVVRALLQVSRRPQLHSQDTNGRDALSVAIIKHFNSPTTAGTNVIRELLAAGADIHAFNHITKTSLPAKLRESLKLPILGSSKVKLTPLQIASSFDEGLAELLKKGASFSANSPI